MYGVVAVISWETGQVLHFVIESKRSISCSRQTLDEDSHEYAEWWETHRASCSCNHQGSAIAMECEAAVELFQRSEEEVHLR